MLPDLKKSPVETDADENVRRHALARLNEEVMEARSSGFGRGPRPIRDVTKDFIAASDRLQPGQLIKDEYFTLFEAVGALEIMDPKMDSGYIPPDDNFDPDFDVDTAISPLEIAWIMDQLICSEMSWHDGYPLSQTVFMSLHMDHLLSHDTKSPYSFFRTGENPLKSSIEARLVHEILRPYCIAVAKCCQLIIQTVQGQNYYEEEDFVTHLYGRELLHDINVDQACTMLEDASEWLENCQDLSDEIREVLQTRVRFRLAYLCSLSGELVEWTLVGILVDDIDQSHHLTEAIPMAFSEKVQRRLASSTPPRPMLAMSWDDAIKKWSSMCIDLVQANTLTSSWICESPHALQRAVWAFAYREPAPNTFARACLQERLFAADHLSEDISHFDLFLTDIRDLVLAGDVLADPTSFQVEMPSDPRHQCSRIIEAFMDKAFEEYLNIYRMVCQNRCRMRRTFTQAIRLFDGLLIEAENCDDTIAGIVGARNITNEEGSNVVLKPLTVWTTYYKLQIMEWIFQLGVETQIYLDDEYALSYWLLSRITQERIHNIENSQRLVADRKASVQKGRTIHYLAECVKSIDWLNCLSAYAGVTALLASTLSKFFSILMATNVLISPVRDYAQQECLYEARMKPFLGLRNNPVPTLSDFHNSQRALTTVKAVCEAISAEIKDAKLLLIDLKGRPAQQMKCTGTQDEWFLDLRQLETTCVAIAVQSSQLLRVCERHGKQDASWGDNLGDLINVVIPKSDSAYHQWWIVPQIKPK